MRSLYLGLLVDWVGPGCREPQDLYVKATKQSANLFMGDGTARVWVVGRRGHIGADNMSTYGSVKLSIIGAHKQGVVVKLTMKPVPHCLNVIA
jgi:hypothetical protein